MLDSDHFHLAIFGLLSLYMPIAIFLFTTKQKHPAIKFREPHLTIISSSFSSIYATSSLFIATFAEEIPCIWGVLSMLITVNIAIWLYLLVQSTLIIRFQLTQQLAKAHVNGNKDEISSYSFHRLFLKRKSKIIINILIYTISSIPALIAVKYDPTMLKEQFVICEYHDGYQLALMLISIESLFQIYLFFYFSRNLKCIVDNFGLQYSFRKTNQYLFVFIVIFFAFFAIEFFSEDFRKYNFRLVASSSAQHVLIYYNVIQPLRKAFVKVEKKDVHENEKTLLEDFLMTEDGFAKFSSFCRIEFSLENIMSWKAVVDYQNEKGDSAQSIYDNYIASNSPFEANIPDSLRQKYVKMFHRNRRNSILKSLANAASSRSEKSQKEKKSKVEAKSKRLSKRLSFFVPNVADEPLTDINYGLIIFVPFREAIVKLMTADTLPRFAKHKLGETWIAYQTNWIQQQKLAEMMEVKREKTLRCLSNMRSFVKLSSPKKAK